jgi:hypothetical protein
MSAPFTAGAVELADMVAAEAEHARAMVAQAWGRMRWIMVFCGGEVS